MPARYVVEWSGVTYRVKDVKEERFISSSLRNEDANNIAKAMNVSASWEPILMTNEMGPSNYIRKEKG